MGDGYAVTPEDLDGAAQGVQDVLDTLADVGHDRGWADAGRGAGGIAVAAGPIGHDGLADALGRFSAGWEWGVRAAVRTGQDMADGLAATAQAYTEGDAAPAGLFGRIYADVTGDPHADPADAQGRTWEQLGDDATRPETAEDRDRALASVGDTWSATVTDVAANSVPGMVVRALDGQNAVADQLDDLTDLWHAVTE